MLYVNGMAASQFVGPFLNSVQKWENDMRVVSEVIDAWLELQRKWLYLEGIFVGGDIRLQLPEEAKKFDNIDKAYRKIMVDTSKRLNVFECCLIQGLLRPIVQGLSKILKKLIRSYSYIRSAGTSI